MKGEVQKVDKNVLVIPLQPLAVANVLPSLPVTSQRSLSIDLIAPQFKAEQLAEAEAEKRRKEKLAEREEKRRMRTQRASGRATFRVD